MRADEVYAILKGKIVKLTEDIKEVGDWKPIRHQGTVQTAEDLPADAKEGYMYNIATDSIYGAAGMNVVKTADGWDPMGPIVNMDLYLSKEEAKKGYQPAGDYLTENKAKKTYQPVGNYSTKEETEKKLNKNQGINNAGKITGINADGDIVPVFPTGVQYNEETNLLEFGTDPNMLNKGIQLDATLKKSGYAADSAAVGENIDSLKEDLSTKITKFYASSQGETHLADSDNGKITDMVLYGRSEQKQYSGKNLVKATLESTTKNGITCTNNGDGTYTLNGTANGGDDTTVSFNVGHMIAKSGKYIVVGCPKGGSSEKYNLRIGKDNIPWGTYVNSDLGNGCLINVTDNTPITLNLMIKDGYTCNNVIFKPMIVDASLYPDTAYDDFEPYTGGIPSPSPDYPQEIKSVVNPTVKVCGKNLLNYKETIINGPDVAGIEFVENGFRIYTKKDVNYCSSKTYLDFSKLRIGETYTLSANLLIVKGVSRLTIRNRVNTIIADSSNITESGTYKISFTLTDQMYYVSFFATFDAAVSGDVIVTDIQLEKNATPTAFEPYHEQTVTLPYTLNAIPVNSGGNVTIDGQQYIADYVDVERGKLVRMCKEYVITGSERLAMYWLGNASYLRNVCCINNFENIVLYDGINPLAMSDMFIGKISENADDERAIYLILRGSGDKTLAIKFLDSDGITTVDLAKQWLIEHKPKIVFVLSTSEEIDLTSEEVQAFKALATYYPITNISINSEQLDGYTVLNYPISMENGWNYVKQQIGDTRDYIYDMDARAQDTDLQAAEAYVNSEYAVALTELEV